MRLNPRVTWRTYRRSRIQNDLPVVPCAAEAIPPAVAARLGGYVAPLREAGFVHALECGPRDPAGTVVNHCVVLAHPTELMRAWVMDLETPHAVQTLVELATRYADGTVLGTSNPGTPSIFDRPPWLQAELLPGASLQELLATHRARVAAVPASPTTPWDHDPLETAQRENEAVLAFQVERGVLKDKGGDYGYSGRGAARTVHRVANGMPDQQ